MGIIGKPLLKVVFNQEWLPRRWPSFNERSEVARYIDCGGRMIGGLQMTPNISGATTVAAATKYGVPLQ